MCRTQLRLWELVGPTPLQCPLTSQVRFITSPAPGLPHRCQQGDGRANGAAVKSFTVKGPDRDSWARGVSVDQCWLPALEFLVHLINLLSMLFRCNDFARIQKAVVDQTGSRPPNNDPDLFLVQVWLWDVLWSFFSIQSLSWSSLVVLQNPLFIAYHNLIEKWFIVVAQRKGR